MQLCWRYNRYILDSLDFFPASYRPFYAEKLDETIASLSIFSPFSFILQSLNHLELQPLHIIFSSFSCSSEKCRISFQSSVVIKCCIRKARLLHGLSCFFVEIASKVLVFWTRLSQSERII